jgi:Eukaryotic membrane protein family
VEGEWTVKGVKKEGGQKSLQRKGCPASGLNPVTETQVAIDVIKHAVISKFNDMRPGLYRELFKDVCEKARDGNSHTARRIIAFDPFAPAAFAVRIALTAGAAVRAAAPAKLQGVTRRQMWVYCGAGWLALLGFKVVLGYGLRATAASYLAHYDLTHLQKGRMPPRPSVAKLESKKLE